MTSTDLSPIIWILTGLAWVSALILLNLARGSRVGALRERAIIALGIAMFGTIYSLAVFNSDFLMVIPTEVIRYMVRVAVVVLLLLPVYWTVLYASGRLGDDGKGGE